MNEQVKNLDLIDIQRLIRILGREKVIILAYTLIFFGIACLYLFLTPSQFTSKSIIYLDRSVTNTVNDIASVRQMGFENASIDSEIEVFKSDRILDKTTALLKDKGYFKDDPEKAQSLRNQLANNLRINRVGETYILEILYTSEDPALSADAANALSQAFIQDQLDNISDMSLRTVNWLRTKLDELSAQILSATQDLNDYRSIYNKTKLKKEGQKDESYTLKEHNRLEKEIETYEQLYDAYLEKLKNIGLQDSFPVTETRIIKHATPPKSQSHPRSTLIIAISLIFGFGIGAFIGIVKDILDSTIKRAGQVKREIGTTLIGFMPPLVHRKKDESKIPNLCINSINNSEIFSAEEIEIFRRIQNTTDFSNTQSTYTLGILSPMDPVLSAEFTERFSRFCAVSMKSTILDGFVSFTQAASQKTTSWFSDEQSYEGCKIALQDYNSLVVSDANQLNSNLIPLYNKRNVEGAIKLAENQSDFVIINCPTLLKKSDFENYLEYLDGIILVMDWGKIKSNELKFMLEDTGIPMEKLLGSVLMNVDIKKLTKHYGHKSLDI
ncbi:MAG: hypothetical protein KTR28_03560 [Micavibrio sp.]|nr:hypothetical protein [Micavibrio sp.]